MEGNVIDPGLSGKVVLVTGANHGIGASIARAFGKLGASALVHFLSFPTERKVKPSNIRPGDALMQVMRSSSGQDVVNEIRGRGGVAEAVEGDLSDPAFIPELFERAEALFGPVDVLVNNAAHGELETFDPAILNESDRHHDLRHDETVHPFTAEMHDRHFAVNSRAVAMMMSEFARRHVARDAKSGAIVNVSTDGAHGFPGEVSYGASKLAMESYSRAAAYELGKYGITVNVVSPGPVQTGYITGDLEEFLIPRIPMGRIGLPADVADAVVFLSSEQARWITGQVLRVGGGNAM